MISLKAAFGKLFNRVEDVLAAPAPAPFDILSNKKVILKEMRYCARMGNLVGVYSPVLGAGMFLLGVDQIVEGIDETLIIFHPLDAAGLPLSRRSISLSEISKIVPFNNPYIKPKVVDDVSSNSWHLKSA